MSGCYLTQKQVKQIICSLSPVVACTPVALSPLADDDAVGQGSAAAAAVRRAVAVLLQQWLPVCLEQLATPPADDDDEEDEEGQQTASAGGCGSTFPLGFDRFCLHAFKWTGLVGMCLVVSYALSRGVLLAHSMFAAWLHA